jgi:hypothetical protein
VTTTAVIDSGVHSTIEVQLLLQATGGVTTGVGRVWVTITQAEERNLLSAYLVDRVIDIFTYSHKSFKY